MKYFSFWKNLILENFSLSASLNMCIQCIKEPLLDRQTLALDTGSYVVNLRECFKCGVKKFPKNKNKKVENFIDEEEEILTEIEEVEFEHHCGNDGCDHIIAPHYYKETTTENGQERFMECVLCGRGSKVIDIIQKFDVAAMIEHQENERLEVLEKLKKVDVKETVEQRQQRMNLYAAMEEKMKKFAPSSGDVMEEESDWSD